MALVLENLEAEIAPEELAEMGSLNHGYLQLKIGSCFLKFPQFTPSLKFSLDISALSVPESISPSDTLEPDISVYEQWAVDFQNDVLKTEKMPAVAIEILSPMQGVQMLVDKFKVYFALGVRSCWLVYPYAQAIAVYRAPDEFTLFAQGDVVDDIVNVRLPLNEVFS